MRLGATLAIAGAATLATFAGCAAPAHLDVPPLSPAAMVPPAPLPGPAPTPTEEPEPEPEPAPKAVTLRLPPRASDAEGARAFVERAFALKRREYEAAVYEAIAAGNVPEFERTLAPVELSHDCADGHTHEATIFVLPDYLAIGSDDDFILVPMRPATAQRIAELTDTVLPTRRIADAVYDAAENRLSPRPIAGGPSPDADDHADFVAHEAMLREQRAAPGFVPGALTAGDKKDIVISNRLLEKSDRVAIYGWHRQSGRPIQSLSVVHSARYLDYSHGVRLVARAMLVDGKPRDLLEVLTDSELSGLVSDEGPLEVVGY